MLDYILTSSNLTVFNGTQILTLTSSARTWEKAKQALKDHDEAALIAAMDLTTAVANFCKGDIRMEDNVVYYKDKPLHNALTQRIIRMAEEGFDNEPLINFLTNVMQNPSNRAIEELYGFLENNNLPVTSDGCFIAYKRIRNDWTDCYTGNIKNTIGAIITMPRNEVDDNCNRTCSHGLHVCSIEYLKNFWGERLIAVKVNPRDVVSVPVDYHNTKMRVCQYQIISELDIDTVKQTDNNWKAVYEDDDDNYDPDDGYDERYFEDDEAEEDQIREYEASINRFNDALNRMDDERELINAGCYGLM